MLHVLFGHDFALFMVTQASFAIAERSPRPAFFPGRSTGAGHAKLKYREAMTDVGPKVQR